MIEICRPIASRPSKLHDLSCISSERIGSSSNFSYIKHKFRETVAYCYKNFIDKEPWEVNTGETLSHCYWRFLLFCGKQENVLRFEVLTSVLVRSTVFWDVKPCSLVDKYQLGTKKTVVFRKTRSFTWGCLFTRNKFCTRKHMKLFNLTDSLT